MGSFYFDFGNASTLDFTSKVSDKKFTALGPPIRIYENGKSCPKCFRTGDNNCDADGEVLCVVSANRSATWETISPSASSYKFRFINIQCSEASGALSSLRRLAFTLEKKDFGP
ncbi:hypothetical protein E2320_000670, partial [Naja naja]